MEIKEMVVKDLLRCKTGKILIRFDVQDLVELACAYNYDYDPVREARKGFKNRAFIPRKIEIKDDDKWRLYPSVTWIDGVEYDEQLVTRAIVKTAQEGFVIVSSSDGNPDGDLMTSAALAGIYTETLD